MATSSVKTLEREQRLFSGLRSVKLQQCHLLVSHLAATGAILFRLQMTTRNRPSTASSEVGQTAPLAPEAHLRVAHALRLRHLVGEIRLLEARGAHPLVHGGVGPRRRVRGVQARLDQGFARFAGDHGLKLAGGKGVDVTRFTGHQQQNLGSCEGGQFIRLERDRQHNMKTGAETRPSNISTGTSELQPAEKSRNKSDAFHHRDQNSRR